MRILVAYASKHESTHEIAEVIGEELLRAGAAAQVRDAQKVSSLDGYDAVVLGSAVYMGNWMAAAKDFADRHHEALVMRPVWLFSSGPIGDDPKPAGEPQGVPPIIELLQPREHVVFSGALVKSDLNVAEKLAVRLVKAPEGDFRDWDAIRSWARKIAAEAGG